MPVAAYREEEPDREPGHPLDVQQIIKYVLYIGVAAQKFLLSLSFQISCRDLGQKCHAEEVSAGSVFQNVNIDDDGDQGSKVILLCKAKVEVSMAKKTFEILRNNSKRKLFKIRIRWRRPSTRRAPLQRRQCWKCPAATMERTSWT